MLVRKFLVIHLMLFLILPASIVSAQTKKPNPTANSGLTIPFETEEQLPSVSKAHDLKLILAALKRQKVEKDQFETSAEYAERISNAPLIGSVTVGSLLAFKFSPLEAFPLCRTEYQADAGSILVKCGLSQKHIFFLPHEGNRLLKSFTVGVANSTDKGSYTASNAFGVKKSVTVRHATGTGLAVSNLGDITTGKHENVLRDLVLTIPNVTPNDARKNLNDIGLLFVVRLASPYLLRETKAQGPTLNSPIDFTGEYEYLYVDLEELWVINLKSGEVFQRLSAKGKPIA